MAKKIGKKKLTDKQRRFCDEYIKDSNAMRAGYSNKGAYWSGHMNLNKPLVKDFLAEKQKKIANKCEITAEKVIRETAKIAFANLQDYLSVDDKGEVKFKPFGEISEDKLAAVKSIKVKQTADTCSIISIKLYNKLDALEKFFKRLCQYPFF